jgi:4-hydroxythreonine-4-phosphate dehydrogenase
MTGCIGISLGDVTGIGPEVTLKALAAELPADDTRYVLLGDTRLLGELNERLALKLPLGIFRGPDSRDRISVANALGAALPTTLSPGAPEAAHVAIAWLHDGAERCLHGELDALVTAPVNKEAIIRAGHAFVGQTEFLSELAGTERTAMMLLGQDDRRRWLRVALATTHVSIRQLPQQVTQPKVALAIELAAHACCDLGLPQARVAVCGLNPHAGEGGTMGDEELTTIGPAVRAAQNRGFNAVGPLSADVVFHQTLRGDYDAVVAMFHDQGLAPLKTVAFDTGINWTLGLPFIRTSPDHGTALDLAGTGKANPASLIAALKLAAAMAERSRGA